MSSFFSTLKRKWQKEKRKGEKEAWKHGSKHQNNKFCVIFYALMLLLYINGYKFNVVVLKGSSYLCRFLTKSIMKKNVIACNKGLFI